jgi:hypothetical protein
MRPIPDELYDRDVLLWAENQADLLRRLGRGEGVNGIDWEHVVEEIEDAGLSERHSVQSYLNLILVHLLKIWVSPDSYALSHWRGEVVALQQNAAGRFAPSMRQSINLAKLYDDAIEQLEAGGEVPGSPRQWPVTWPFTLDQLLQGKWATLEDRLNVAAAMGQVDTPQTPDR